MSNNKKELQRFADWLSGGRAKLYDSKSTWIVPTIERMPGSVAIPVIEPGVIEYEKKQVGA